MHLINLEYHLPNHPINQQCPNNIIKNQFMQFRITTNYQIPPRGVDIPTQALQLVKSFYSIWLDRHIKLDLIVCNL